MDLGFLFEQRRDCRSAGCFAPHPCGQGCNLVHLGVRRPFYKNSPCLVPCRVLLSIGFVVNVLDQASRVVSAPFFQVSLGTQMGADNAPVFSPEIVVFVLGVAVQQVMELWDAGNLLGRCRNPADQHIPGPVNLVHGNQLSRCAPTSSPLCHQFHTPLIPWLNETSTLFQVSWTKSGKS